MHLGEAFLAGGLFWLRLAAFSVSTYAISRTIYHLFLSPLKRIPGPWYAAISNGWLTGHALLFRKYKAVDQAFRTYGPVVRVGPNTVAFLDIPTMRMVYGSTGKYAKDQLYQAMRTCDNDSSFTLLEHAPHVTRKKSISPHYVTANLAQYQTEIRALVLQVIDKLDNVARQTPVDCLTLFRSLTVDVTFLLTYGETMEAIKNWTPLAEHPMSKAVHDFMPCCLIKYFVPTWFWKAVSCFPISKWKQFCNCESTMSQHVILHLQKFREELHEGREDPKFEAGKIPLLSKLMRHRIDQQLMPDKDIISECMVHGVAAVDATSTTAGYLIWELSRRPKFTQKIQAELDLAIIDAHDIPDIQSLQRLPHLDALIKEVLRVHSIAPSILPRVVPEGGLSILGHFLPAGTIVGTQSWTLHRDPNVFPDPFQFDPDRWLAATVEMNNSMIPFGYGTRICAGQHLVIILLKTLAAGLLRNFDITAPPETNERTMRVLDAFTIRPTGNHCNMIFSPRNT